MAVDTINTLNQSVPDPFENTLESIKKSPEIKAIVESKIHDMASKIPQFPQTPKAIYEQIMGIWVYKDQPEQLARVFSYLFIKNRDEIKITDQFRTITLKNVNGTLNVRQEWDLNTVVALLGNGVTVKDLWKTKEFNGLTYTLVEFYSTGKTSKKWYISVSHSEWTQENSLQQLNGYIRSLGMNPTNDFKQQLLGKIYFWKEYQVGTEESNTEIYHKLVQDFELRKLVEASKITLDTKKRTRELIQKTPNIISQEIPHNIETKIKNDVEIMQYLQGEFPWKSFNDSFIAFKKREGRKWLDVTSSIMTYAFLFQKSKNIFLSEYYKMKSGKSWEALWQEEKKELFHKYTGDSHAKYRSSITDNLAIFRGLIIEYELGNTYVATVENIQAQDPNYTKTQPNFKANLDEWIKDEVSLLKQVWLDLSKISNLPAEYDTEGSLCSRTVRLSLVELWLLADWPESAQALINRRSRHRRYANTHILEKRLIQEALKTWENTFDILAQTNNGHRLIAYISDKDWQVYVRDPYYGAETPILLREYNAPAEFYIFNKWYTANV